MWPLQHEIHVRDTCSLKEVRAGDIQVEVLDVKEATHQFLKCTHAYDIYTGGVYMQAIFWDALSCCSVEYTHIHTYTHAYIHTYVRACIHTLHAYMLYFQSHCRKYIHTYLHEYIRIHTSIHTYIHTYILVILTHERSFLEWNSRLKAFWDRFLELYSWRQSIMPMK